jgi:hypothetical protein
MAIYGEEERKTSNSGAENSSTFAGWILQLLLNLLRGCVISKMSTSEIWKPQRASQANMDDEGENEFVSEQVNEIVKVAFWLHFHASWSSVLQSQREEPMKISPELGPSYDQSDQGKPLI